MKISSLGKEITVDLFPFVTQVNFRLIAITGRIQIVLIYVRPVPTQAVSNLSTFSYYHGVHHVDVTLR
jgi:hypothetical protein